MEFHRIEVEDAVSYLDEIKIKFGNQPHIYNEFLDILIEFKSKSIDTPGVLQRVLQQVSHLFRGHPELIMGFNTFLPPQYRIELPNEHVQISIPEADMAEGQGSHQNSPPHSQTGCISTGSENSPDSDHPSTYQLDEFRRCMNYVIKIKNRFEDQPEIYKRFLEILQAYKERSNLKYSAIATNKPITEGEVYYEVAKLFQNHEDLLQDFGQFLSYGMVEFSWIWHN